MYRLIDKGFTEKQILTEFSMRTIWEYIIQENERDKALNKFASVPAGGITSLKEWKRSAGISKTDISREIK